MWFSNIDTDDIVRGLISFIHQFILLVFTSDDVCKSYECLRANEWIQQNMAIKGVVNPCVNFYNYACKNFATHHHIPPHVNILSLVDIRNTEIDEEIKDYLKKMDNTKPAGFLKIREFYDMCINEDKISVKGYETLQHELSLMGMPLIKFPSILLASVNNYGVLLGKLHRLFPGSEFLFSVGVKYDSRRGQNMILISSIDSPEKFPFVQYVEIVKQSGSSSEHAMPESGKSIMALKDLVLNITKDLYQHLGSEVTDEEMKEAIEEEARLLGQFIWDLHEVRQQHSSNDTKSMFSPEELQKEVDEYLNGGEIQINIKDYLKEVFNLDDIDSLKTREINIGIMILHSTQFMETLKILQKTSAAVFESALWWCVVQPVITEGPKTLRQYYNSYMESMGYTVSSHPSYYTHVNRELYCMNTVKLYFANFVNYLLTTKMKDTTAKKEKMKKMFEYIRRSYEELIGKADYFTEDLKTLMQNKMRTITAQLGFDDSLTSEAIAEEYEQIAIQPDNFYLSLSNLRRMKREKQLSTIFELFDFNKKPKFTSAYPVSIYVDTHNFIGMTLAYFGFPCYDYGLEILNYAFMGFILAREMGHAVFNTDYTHDEKGNILSNVALYNDEYQRVLQCFIDHYNNMDPIRIGQNKNMKVDGKSTLEENLADWQGFKIALMAYQKYVEERGPEKKLYDFQDFTPEKLFTLAFASFQCATTTDSYLNTAMSNPYAPHEARVNGVLQNSDEFSKAWGCPTPSKMNPEKKCKIFP